VGDGWWAVGVKCRHLGNGRKRRLKSLLRFGKLRNYVTRELRQPGKAQAAGKCDVENSDCGRCTASGSGGGSSGSSTSADLRQLNKNEVKKALRSVLFCSVPFQREKANTERCKTLTNTGPGCVGRRCN